MIDSYWRLNLDHPTMQRQARNIHEMHRNVCTMLGSDRASIGALWALDPGGVLVIRSPELPDGEALDAALGLPVPALTFFASAPVPEMFTGGSSHRFQLTASNTKRDIHTQAIVPVHAETWLRSRMAQHGFVVDDLDTRVAKARGGGGGRSILLSIARYTGTLTITEPEAFANAMRRGIGRGKAYGCGLITID